jgi:hypothetical protein
MHRGVLALTLALCAAAGCKPKEGAECKIETKQACVDPKNALACHGGKWEKQLCKGPKGCVTTGSSDGECDQSTADKDDVCNLPDDHACAPDKKSMIRCVKYKFATVETCSGPNGCERTEKEARCDNSTAASGDPCTEPDDHACSPDSKTMLVCKSGKFDELLQCKGPKGCSLAGTAVRCDDSVAILGDACEATAGKDHYACAQDGRSMLKCIDRKFVQAEKCRGRETCKLLADGFACSIN